MSANYQPVLWNRQKKIYDSLMAGGIALYLLVFTSLNALFFPESTAETLIIRAFGTLAFLMLHIILLIGPFSRLNKKFVVLLYNRRHLGVTMFVMAAVHGVFSIIQFHSGGDTNALVSVFASNTHYDSFIHFPFQILGFFSLVILFLMAASSHDFWLHNLSPKVWKSLHMLVYLVYVMIILHVMLGVIQVESSPWLVGVIILGFIALVSLHLAAGIKEVRKDIRPHKLRKEGFVYVCNLEEIREKRARVVTVGKESIAIFKYDGKLSAVSNVCKHQNGPLGEGKIIDGCITCPWHGYQYLPENGCSPPPFTEKVATYDVLLDGKSVWVHPKPYPDGTPVTPVFISKLQKI